MRKLADWVEAYLEYTEDSEPPTLYKEWAAISTIAAALQRKVYINWDSRKYPNMYIVLVGSSGKTRKGTAMYPAQKLLRELGIKTAAEAITREALIRELSKTTDNVTDPDTQKIKMHSSLTIFSKELTVFIGYNNAQLMADLADWYDCDDRWVYRTKTQGDDEIHGVWVNMIGATTPDLLRTTLPQDAIGGGLTSRIVFVYEDRKSKLVPLPFLQNFDHDLEQKLIEDLQQISMMAGEYRFTETFTEEWIKWYGYQDANPPFKNDPAFDGYVSRRPTHVLKLCMIFNAARSDSMIIDETDLQRSIKLLERTEVKMASTFRGVGESDIAGLNAKIISVMHNAPEGGYEVRDLLRMFMNDADKDTLMRALATLHASDFLQLVEKPGGKVMVRKLKEDQRNPDAPIKEADDEDDN